MTTIYLIRHSKATKNSLYVKFASHLTKNKNLKLDDEGVMIANNFLNNPIFDNISFIYSSDYNRAKQTAKILAKRLKKKVIIDKRFGERTHGDEIIPTDFEERQMLEKDYKLNNGESQEEVRYRMLSALNDVLKQNKNSNVAIFTHSTAIAFLLKEWCDIKYNDSYKFNDKVFFDGKWNYCETFKLIFDENKLVDIANVKARS